MAVIFSSSNMIVQIRNHSSASPPSVKAFASSKGGFVNPINFKFPSNFTHNPSSFAIKAYQDESKLEPKRSISTPSKPKLANFKEPIPEKQSLTFVDSKQSPKERTATQTSLDYQLVLKYPLVTEAAIQKIIKENTLVFMVDVRANKKDIRNAFENMLKIKTKKINTLINYDGTKKAFIQLSPENQATTVAKKMKILA
ncbi:unnamed protein product [Lactuca virosa]|uniref:Ribosomal protein L23/L25 N-terminal domain-containing protein n=1 Tax=Lactuca virosa TaxID=75947 RepID=A0AAU9M9F0_9ASTR|nr:unnamed protein product [Lactuca virosa]